MASLQSQFLMMVTISSVYETALLEAETFYDGVIQTGMASGMAGETRVQSLSLP